MTLVLDNFDSFTWNLVQLLGTLGANPVTIRNNARTVDAIRELEPERIVLSPGPGRPEGAGISLDLIRGMGRDTPILGVCLGLQCVVRAHGGSIRRARHLVHGKTSLIRHSGAELFGGLDDPFPAMRYHSLVAGEPLPPDLEVTARSNDDGEIMGIRHRTLAIWGVQFHPESILTPSGVDLVTNFLNLTNTAD